MLSYGKKILIGILLLAGILRLFQITYHDSYTDEAIYGFRSIGLIDYDGSTTQTSPWQWLEPLPSWAHWSFHDHPLGFFVLQHLFMQIFGENILAVRLPTVLAGIGAVGLVYLIAKKLWGEKEGLIAAGILAVQSYQIWVARVGIQDGVVILWLLLDFFILLKVKEKPQYWLFLGSLVGLGIVLKYTTLIIFPIIGLYLLIEKIKFWQEKYFWYGAASIIFWALPVIGYNIRLYQVRGHFDFQFSALLGQEVPEWSFRMGREMAGNLGAKFKNFWVVMGYGNSQLFNLAAGLSFLGSFIFWIKKKDKKIGLVVGTTIMIWLWLMVIGSTYRFVTMIIPWLILLLSVGIARALTGKFLGPVKIGLASLLLFEGIFSINTFFLHPSLGTDLVTYARINEETQNFGFNELDEYLIGLMGNKVSALVGTPEYGFLGSIQEKRFAEKSKQRSEARSLMIVYDKNSNSLANLWVLQRWAVYDGWPVITDTDFITITNGKMDEYYREQGVKEFVYVAAESKSVLEKENNDQPVKRYLENQGIKPKSIKNKAGETAFLVYEF